MSHPKHPVVLIHGYSDKGASFKSWADILVAKDMKLMSAPGIWPIRISSAIPSTAYAFALWGTGMYGVFASLLIRPAQMELFASRDARSMEQYKSWFDRQSR